MRGLLFGFVIMLGLGSLSVSYAIAQESMSIAAVVNDDVVTVLDLTARTQLAIVSANLKDDAEQRKRLAPQVLRVLIDEKLKLQEARRLGITVSDEEVRRRYEDLAKNNQLPLAEFEKRLREGGIEPSALNDKIRSDIAWARVVRRRAGNAIKVPEEEVTEALREVEQGAGKPEYLLSEIFLSTEGREDAPQAAQRLLDQLREGADFASLAREFSQSGSAEKGGDLGWVPTADLEASILATLELLDNGQITAPITVPGGLRMIQLRGKRLAGAKTTVNIHLKQMLLPVGSKILPTQEVAAEKVKELVRPVKTCADFDALVKRIRQPISADAKAKTLDELAPALRAQIAQLNVNQMTPALKIPNGIAIFMLCKREEVKVDQPLPSRRQIEDRLLEQRLEFSAKSYLRDLRRAAYVDIRV